MEQVIHLCIGLGPGILNHSQSGTGNGWQTISESGSVNLALRPISIIPLEKVKINLIGSGSSGNPYTLEVK